MTTHVYPKTALHEDLEVPHILEQRMLWLGTPRIDVTYTVYPIHRMGMRHRQNAIYFLQKNVEPLWEGYDDKTVRWCDRWFELLSDLDPDFDEDDAGAELVDEQLPFPRIPVGEHLLDWLHQRPLFLELLDANADHMQCRSTCPWACGRELDPLGAQPCDLLSHSPPNTRMFAGR